ncbi:MAG: DUF4445 domain-containing protein [Candidatus Aminicenantes bacterium]|nr:MAG: DUF4445 domain-containing protein [Candidatus Aminicenantes bacterium]
MGKGISQKKHRVTFLPFDISVNVPEGTKLADAIQKVHLPFSFPCGGEGTCGDCIVRITHGTYLAKPTAALSGQYIAEGFALACQTDITDDLVIVLPDFAELTIKTIASSEFFQSNKANMSGFIQFNPRLILTELRVPSPTLEDNYSDLERLEKAYKKQTGIKKVSSSLSVLPKLARILRSKKGSVQVVSFRETDEAQIVDVLTPARDKKIYGLACDIGTSTVALHLIDLGSGDIVSTTSSLNQQIKCGEDIISRINYSQKPGHLKELQKLVVHTINNLIRNASQKSGVSQADIYYAVFTGNTTMSHLLLKIDPHYIREEPYVPTFNDLPLFPAAELGLMMNPEAKISLSPSVGSYVGGDITAGLLSTPILRSAQKISLFIDAGTNGELVVGNKDWLMTCACSAGPAFEGSGIQCGMPASEGAIEAIKLDTTGRASYRVIGGTKPKGLCGSGLVDLLAELFIHGYIDRHGKFRKERNPDRIMESEEGIVFLVEDHAHSFWGNDICITEKDIANLLRTKGAVYSACSILLKNVGLRNDEIASIYIAGGFGQHLDVENAIRIGLLPDLERERFHYIGNSSLLGAYLILFSDENRAMVQNLAKKMTYIELNTEPSYMNEFTGSMFLPHTEMKLFPSVKKLLS